MTGEQDPDPWDSVFVTDVGVLRIGFDATGAIGLDDAPGDSSTVIDIARLFDLDGIADPRRRRVRFAGDHGPFDVLLPGKVRLIRLRRARRCAIPGFIAGLRQRTGLTSVVVEERGLLLMLDLDAVTGESGGGSHDG